MTSDSRHTTRAVALLVSGGLHALVAVLLIAFWRPTALSPIDRATSGSSTTAGAARATARVTPPPAPRSRAASSLPAATSTVTSIGGSVASTARATRQLAATAARPAVVLLERAQPTAASWLRHLVESTLFAAATWLVILLFRSREARLRYALWFAASMKFLLPFALLIALGRALPRATIVSVDSSGFAPFTDSGQTALWSSVGLMRVEPAVSAWPAIAPWLPSMLLGVWIAGVLAVVRMRASAWLRIRRDARASRAVAVDSAALPPHLQVRESASQLEPGVLGFWRPIILLPKGLTDHLTRAQLDTILLHELAHIERRDNLTAALHMAVEAVFWFHPMVWWMGARLLEERERACDEAVLRRPVDPRAYADGIVAVCKRYLESGVVCVAGVGGGNLRRRIESILHQRHGEPIGAWRTVLLTAAALITVGVPIVVGTQQPVVLVAQTGASSVDGPGFEVASIKQNLEQFAPSRLEPQPGGRFIATGMNTLGLIRFAYDLPDFLVTARPAWTVTDLYDVAAKAEGAATLAQHRLMVRRLLNERFKLTAHTELRDMPTYTMTLSRGAGQLGPRLRRASGDCARNDRIFTEPGPIGMFPDAGSPACQYFGFAPGADMPSGHVGLGFRGLTMDGLSKQLTMIMRRAVIDRTGLAGYFDGDFDMVAEIPPPPPPPGAPNPFTSPFVSAATVLPEQLGLKLEPGRGQMPVLVIDQIERPTEN